MTSSSAPILSDSAEAPAPAPDAEPIAPDAEPIAPDAEPIAPDAEPIAPDAEPIAPKDQIASDTLSPVEADANTSQAERENFIDTPPQNDDVLLPVVGLGGSAGSIKALQDFFGRIPSDLGVAYVVVVHLSPDFESQLPQILRTRTKMTVVQVQGSVAVEANHVYVIPPAHHLTMEGGNIHLAPPQQDRGKRVAVDLFFRTLATARRSKAAAIVLSGTDGDGAIGIKRIKEHGGVTIAQSPDEAEHPSMPRTAIETGMVDWVLTIEGMADKLVDWVGNDRRIHLPASDEPLLKAAPSQGAAPANAPDADEVALREVLSYLHLCTGHDFAHYKRATVLRRIMRRLQVNSLESLPQYADYLRTHPGEAGALLQDLLISVTNFFRDPEAYAALGAHLPELFRGVRAGETLRVWVPGCATGEEAYSLAMILAEYGETLDNAPEVQIFATDLDDQALKVARDANYPATIHADVSPERLRRFFVFDQGHYRVKKEVRERVLFASHNLLRDAPFSRLDLVSCRNLLIYFNRIAQDKVLDVFHFALKPDALLFLGTSETAEDSPYFRSKNKKFRIYERQIATRNSGFPLPNLGIPLPTPSRNTFRPARATLAASASPLALQPRNSGAETVDLPAKLTELASQLADLAPETADLPSKVADSVSQLANLLNNFAPEGFSSAEEKASDASGDGRIAIRDDRTAVRDASFANRDDRIAVRDASFADRDDRIAVHDASFVNRDASFADRDASFADRDASFVDRDASFANRDASFADRDASRAGFGALHLHLLEQSAPPSILVDADYEVVHLSARAGGFLRLVGGAVSTNLLAMVHPALRLELRAALFRAVQSGEDGDVPPTLIEVEGQARNVSVRVRPMAVSDAQNTRGAFVLVIFDEAAVAGETLLPAPVVPDVVARRLDGELQHLKAVLRASVEQFEVSSEELKASNEELLALNEEQHAAGEELETSREEISAANEELTTVNSELKSSIEELSRTNDDLRNLIASTDIATVFLSRDGRIKRFTPRALELFRLIPGDVGRPLEDMHHPFATEFLSEAAQSVLQSLSTQEHETQTLDGKWFLCRLSPYRTGEDRIDGVVISFVDITERKRIEESKTFLAEIIESSRDSVVGVDYEGTIASWNRAAEELYGFAASEVVGHPYTQLSLPEDLRKVLINVEKIRRHETVEIFDTVRLHKDGHEMNLEVALSPIKDAGGEVVGVSTFARDVSERRRAQEAQREVEERLSVLIESVHDYAIFTLDDAGLIESWNSGAERIFGYAASEISGQAFAQLFTPEDRVAGAPGQELEGAVRAGHSADERWHLRKDGTQFYASGVLTPLSRGAKRGFVKVARDLTEQKQAETLLREGEARIRTVSDAIPQMVWTNQPDGCADYFNQRWHEFSGLNFEESVGRGWEAIVHPDDAEPARAKWHSALARGEVFDVEYRLRRADGVYCWQIGRNVPLRDDEGRVIGWFGTNTDIQEFKQAQESLGKARDELEWRVEERTRDLGEALGQLRGEIIEREKIEAARRDLLGRLVNSQEEERGRISRELHDNLGQHLTAVMLGLKMLESQTQAVHQDDAMRASFGNLSGLVDALMQAAHRQAWELRPAELDDMGLEVALRSYVNDWGKRTAIPIDFHANGWEDERLDPALEIVLYRVVQEALTNVARHSSASRASVILELNSAGASAIIEDNGSGFSPAADQGRLGLLGMRERLALVGGTLEIESTPGETTTLFARVPHLLLCDADVSDAEGDKR